jgi:hypothetical protein
VAANKPVLCCFHKNKKVSKMILGNTYTGLTLEGYESLSQIPGILTDWLQIITGL